MNDPEPKQCPQYEGAHPRLVQRWLCDLDDWVDDYQGFTSFNPALPPSAVDHEIFHISSVQLDRLRRESEAYYAMRRAMRDTVTALLQAIA